jgi:hypothetical protein
VSYAEQPLGDRVSFLLPSLKLKPFEGEVHRFLMAEFGGYTVAAGNIFGYWKDDSGGESYGEHRLFTVALSDPGKLELIKGFLSRLARQLGEKTIYTEIGGRAVLIS